MRAVASSISRLPKLEDLSITTHPTLGQHSYAYEHPPLMEFCNLKSLALTWTNSGPAWYTKEDLISVFEGSPDLLHLTLNGWDSCEQSTLVLQELFDNLNSFPQLEALEVSGFKILSSRIKGLISPNLKRLWLYQQPHASFPYAAFWSRCKEHDVRLRSLYSVVSTSNSKSLFEYLLSYRGLVDFELSAHTEARDPDHSASRMLWERVVPQHQSTLKRFFMDTKFDGTSEWCYGPLAAHALEPCSQIIHLSLSIFDLILIQMAPNPAPSPNRYQSIVNPVPKSLELTSETVLKYLVCVFPARTKQPYHCLNILQPMFIKRPSPLRRLIIQVPGPSDLGLIQAGASAARVYIHMGLIWVALQREIRRLQQPISSSHRLALRIVIKTTCRNKLVYDRRVANFDGELRYCYVEQTNVSHGFNAA
jgi:hypothetical protein